MITLILAWTSGGNTRSGCGGAWSGQTLFGMGPEYLLSAGSDFYDIAPDDRQFLMARRCQGDTVLSGDGPKCLVQNFFEELRQVVPD